MSGSSFAAAFSALSLTVCLSISFLVCGLYRGEGGLFGLDRGWCILAVKKSACGFLVGFICGRIR